MVKCEFYDVCYLKYTKNGIKSHCSNIIELYNTDVVCVMRENVFKILRKQKGG